MQQIRKGGFRRLAVVVAVAVGGILVVGAQAASAGTLEICKSGANGMAGKTFNFTVTPNAGTPIGTSVKPAGAGFTCTSVITIAGATSATVKESDPIGQTTETASISVIPISREVPGTNNPGLRQITVNLGTTTANETIVRFVNQAVGGTSGTLKVCKTSETFAYLDRSFSFSVNGGPLVSTPANDAFGDPAFYSCRILGTFSVPPGGTVVRVKEAIPSGTVVKYIDTDPGSGLVDFNTDDCTVTPTPTALTCGESFIRVMPGTTIVYYDDEPIPPQGNGFVEVCKNALPGTSDPAVTGFWDYTITDQDGIVVGSAHVLTGQCQDAIPVPAGILTVTEAGRTGFQLVDVSTIPSDALVNSNLINGSADVEVATTTDPTQETLVNFVNKPITSQLKICKALGANSSVLAGQTFKFKVTNITDPANPVPLGWANVTAGSTTQCTIFGTLPTGTVVRVDEVFAPVDDPTTPLYDESGQYITTTGTATTTIANGTANTVTITNTAYGLLEICKNPVAGLSDAAQPVFQFRIDGGGIIPVRAGICGEARKVSIGNHTVTEVASGDFDVSSITVDPSGRIVPAAPGTVNPDLANRSVTVVVPYAFFQETAVTYTNTIKTGSVKVCKTIPTGSTNSLSPAAPGRTYNFTASVQTSPGNPGGFTQYPLSVTLKDGALTACSGQITGIPVLQTDGTNTIVGILETTTGNFVVDDIILSFTRGYCSGTYPNPGAYPGMNCIPGGKSVGPGGTQNVNFFLNSGPQFATFYQHAT